MVYECYTVNADVKQYASIKNLLELKNELRYYEVREKNFRQVK